MKGIVIPPNVGPLARLCGEHASWPTAGVRVVDLNGAYRLEATDGKRLAVVRQELDPEEESQLEGPSPRKEFIVPAKDWLEAWRAMSKAVTNRPRGMTPFPACLEADDQAYRFNTVGFEKSGPLVEGKWPPSDDVLPKAPPLMAVGFDPKLLASLCDLASSLGLARVDILLWKGDGPVGLVGHNEEGQFLDALLMPLSPPPANNPPARHPPAPRAPAAGPAGVENGRDMADNEPPADDEASDEEGEPANGQPH